MLSAGVSSPSEAVYPNPSDPRSRPHRQSGRWTQPDWHAREEMPAASAAEDRRRAAAPPPPKPQPDPESGTSSSLAPATKPSRGEGARKHPTAPTRANDNVHPTERSGSYQCAAATISHLHIVAPLAPHFTISRSSSRQSYSHQARATNLKWPTFTPVNSQPIRTEAVGKFVATHRENRWPSVGTFDDRQWGDSMAAVSELLRLSAPDEDRPAEHAPDALVSRVVNGGADDVVMSDLFGLERAHPSRSDSPRGPRVLRLQVSVTRPLTVRPCSMAARPSSLQRRLASRSVAPRSHLPRGERASCPASASVIWRPPSGRSHRRRSAGPGGRDRTHG